MLFKINKDQDNILVVGDIILDRYWIGNVTRISPEAPVPIVKMYDSMECLGGAANVALNIAKLGGKVTLLGIVGNDDDGHIIRNILDREGINYDLIVSKTKTISKLRVLSQHQQMIRLDFEDNLYYADSALTDRFAQHVQNNKIVVFSDYGKGTLRNVHQFITTAQYYKAVTIVDPKGTKFDKYIGCDIITPNTHEFTSVFGECTTTSDIQLKAQQLLNEYFIKNLVLTRGEHGMAILNKEYSVFLPADAKEVYDVTGAGDTVVATLAVGLANNLSLRQAVELSIVSSGIVVGKLGVSTVTVDEINKKYDNINSIDKIVSKASLQAIYRINKKTEKKKFVFTNGCFDILHPGHINFLSRAKQFGDKLVVAVNTDESIKRLKGENRPINILTDRMYMLAALECVDYVVSFDEDTPLELYSDITPDILIKGGDYELDDIVGKDLVIEAGGIVTTLPIVDNYSTTLAIQKIQEKI